MQEGDRTRDTCWSLCHQRRSDLEQNQYVHEWDGHRPHEEHDPCEPEDSLILRFSVTVIRAAHRKVRLEVGFSRSFLVPLKDIAAGAKTVEDRDDRWREECKAKQEDHGQ